MDSPYTGNTIKLPLMEILKTFPEIFGLRVNEEPSYTLVKRDGEVELRRYGPAVAATVTVKGNSDRARSEAFKRLAAYIFGENKGSQKIAMTAPVLQQPSKGEKIAMTAPVLQAGSGATSTMSFLLPKEFLKRKVPSPLDPSISITRIESRTVAALRYRGNNSEQKKNASRAKLEAWLKAHPKLKPLSDIYWAQYDAPFVIPFFKKNEALVEVRAR